MRKRKPWNIFRYQRASLKPFATLLRTSAPCSPILGSLQVREFLWQIWGKNKEGTASLRNLCHPASPPVEQSFLCNRKNPIVYATLLHLSTLLSIAPAMLSQECSPVFNKVVFVIRCSEQRTCVLPTHSCLLSLIIFCLHIADHLQRSGTEEWYTLGTKLLS